MGNDLINNKVRYCLWLTNATPNILRIPEIHDRIKKVQEFRLNSKKKATRLKAQTPYLFDEIKDCKDAYIAIPVVSSQIRHYIPMAYLDPTIIAGNKLFEIEHASVYDFGVLESKVHMAWMRTIAGRLKSDFSYSNTLVLNNFPWAKPTEGQQKKIEETAQEILDARAKYPNSSLADLYDPLTMPKELVKAHQENDKAVLEAYGLSTKATESEIVAHLFKMYERLTKKEKNDERK